MRIALVHDYLVQYGGAERVLEAFTELWPYAPIYTLLYDPEAMHGRFAGKRIYSSFLQRMPFARRRHRFFPPLMPLAIEEFDFSAYDVVLSDSSSYAKGIITRPETLHICYMHTPMRYAWDDCQKYTRDFGFPQIVKGLVPFFMNPIRVWDRLSADRVDKYIANSDFVARRIRKYYDKSATVIHPPVDVGRFQQHGPPENYFLMVGRLIAYKRHDIAITAFNRLGLPLKIIGRGPELDRLRHLAGPNIEFLGRISDEELPHYYARCRGFVFPQEEDFGIVAMEALASGRPLIAYRGGDIVEHLKEGIMGVYFDEQTPEALIRAVECFQDSEARFQPEVIRREVRGFDKSRFQERIRSYVTSALVQHQARLSEHT